MNLEVLVLGHLYVMLCSAWKDDGMTVFTGGCDKRVKMWPLLSGGQPTAFSGHEAPIKELAWVPQMNLLVSGSWDKTLRCGNSTKHTRFIHIFFLEIWYSSTINLCIDI